MQGRLEALKRTIKRQESIKYGPGKSAHHAAIDRIADIETLEAFSERVLFADGRDDFRRDIPHNSDDAAAPR